MKNEWILDVLSDLRSYAVSNQLDVLAEQLDDARLVAAAELANLEGDMPPAALTNGCVAGANRFLRAAGGRA
ncbi:hypothetical protein ACP2AV_05565 [Aliiroseovarius sp. PTFE2010]|uniref:hypothetical protein n=1 Tax=Aliiroseovarius sp. PTFE2010 TaxID=3417190 RepID=UPI003CE9A668